MSAQDDPLHDAEQQMAEHEMELLCALIEEVDRRLRRAPGDPVSDTEDIREAMIEAMAEDPHVRELAEGLAAFQRARTEEEDDAA